MERWHVGVNGYFGSASIYRQSGPWWSFVIERVMWQASHALHTLIGWIPLPGLLTKRQIVDDGETYTWGEWHGTKLGQLFWLVETPIFDWCVQHRRVVHILLSFQQVRDAFGDEAPAHWAEDWDEGTKMWQNAPPDPARGTVYRTA